MAQLPDLVAVRGRGRQGVSDPRQELSLLQPGRSTLAKLAFSSDGALLVCAWDDGRFAAIEAKQRGHGGITYIARVLGCSEKTIARGMAELDQLEEDPVAGRTRRPGAGRKKRSSPSLKRKTI